MEKVREIFTKSNFEKYFAGLAQEKDAELLSKAISEILEHRLENLCEIGRELFKSNILITHFFYILEKVISLLEKDGLKLALEDMLTAKKMLSKGYIYEELNFDKRILQRYLNRRIVAESRELTNALNTEIGWMISFINSILNNTIHEKDTLEKWLATANRFEFDNLHDDNYEKIVAMLKVTAERLARAYAEGKYFYFSVLYRELMGYSSKMQNLLILNYMSEEIISIYTDYLTGLSNQLKLKKDLKSLKDRYLLLIDIQDFRKINVSMGFDAGDKVLQSVARRLKELKVCTPYRFIGNEFALVVNDRNMPAAILNELESSVFYVNEKPVSLFFYGSFGRIDDNILELAEEALIEAKKVKDHLINVDDRKDSLTSTVKKSDELFSINIQLKLAIATDGIKPYLQGIYHVSNLKKPARYEALVRIESKTGETLSPAQFRHTLKNTYLYPEATKMLFLKCAEIVEEYGTVISFNLSMLDIMNPNTRKFFKSVLLEKPDVANRITFEITEEEAIEKFKEVKIFIEDIKKLGAKIAIDDFGSGYSNFSYIFSMNPDYIKIDGALVSEILTNQKQVIFVKSLVEMCRNIGIQTTAEYVDSKEKVDKLIDLGVDFLQGFYLHKPEPYESVLKKMESRPS